MMSQHLFRSWSDDVKQQTIIWAYVDPVLCRRMVFLGKNVLDTFNDSLDPP